MTDATQLMADLQAAVVDLSPTEAAALVAPLGRVTLVLGARMAGTPGAPADPAPANSLTPGGPAPADYLRLAELAARLRVGQSTIRKKVQAGELVERVHFFRNGRYLIFYWPAIEAWLRGVQATRGGAPTAAVCFRRRGRRRG